MLETCACPADRSVSSPTRPSPARPPSCAGCSRPAAALCPLGWSCLATSQSAGRRSDRGAVSGGAGLSPSRSAPACRAPHSSLVRPAPRPCCASTGDRQPEPRAARTRVRTVRRSRWVVTRKRSNSILQAYVGEQPRWIFMEVKKRPAAAVEGPAALLAQVRHRAQCLRASAPARPRLRVARVASGSVRRKGEQVRLPDALERVHSAVGKRETGRQRERARRLRYE